MAKFKILYFLLCFNLAVISFSSNETQGHSKQHSEILSQNQIPFKVQRNKIILPVTVNGSRELQVILDTGMHFEGLLLYKKELTDEIGIKDAIDVEVGGAGGGAASTAITADSMTFQVGRQEFINQRIIILQNDRMKGFPSDGVVGYSLFKDYCVEIDYDLMKLFLYDSLEVLDSSWEWISMTFKDNNIPWIEAEVSINGDDRIPVAAYIDLASSEAIEMLTREDTKFQLPTDLKDYYLGRGLSGDIYGQRGTISYLKIGSFYLKNVLATFATAETRSKQQGADGVIANNALRRFNLIFDYKKKRLYINPNSSFNDPFD